MIGNANMIRTKRGVMSCFSGMTLIEVMIAVFVFGIGIAGVASIVTKSRQTQDRARSHYVAINMAKNKIEQARGLMFDSLNTVTQPPQIVNNDYRMTVAMTNLTPNLKEMTVSVEIRNRRSSQFGKEREVVRSLFTEFIQPP